MALLDDATGRASGIGRKDEYSFGSSAVGLAFLPLPKDVRAFGMLIRCVDNWLQAQLDQRLNF